MCGPFSVASIEKNNYYVIFVDDLYRNFWIYFMQKKDKTFSNFLEFKALVEKDMGKNLKALRSENGSGFMQERNKIHK